MTKLPRACDHHSKTLSNKTHRLFASKSGTESVILDSNYFDQYPFFRVMFEVNEGVIKIDGDFRMFKKVIKFARYPGWRRRLLLDEGEPLLVELDYYGIFS